MDNLKAHKLYNEIADKSHDVRSKALKAMLSQLNSKFVCALWHYFMDDLQEEQNGQIGITQTAR